MKRLLTLSLLLLGAPLLAEGALSPTASAAEAPSLAAAKVLWSGGKLAEAAAMYEAMGVQHSHKTEGWRLNNWGYILMTMDKAGEAEPILAKAVDADPKNFTAWANLAGAYERIGDRVKACDVYRKALELLRSENAAVAAGRHNKAQDEMGNAVNVSGDAETFDELPTRLKGDRLIEALKEANQLMDEEKFQEAADAYAKIGMTSPAKREGWRLNNWGLALIRIRDYHAALPRLKKSVEIFPDNSKAWNNLGVAYENLSMSQEAKDAYTRAASSGESSDTDSAKIDLNNLKLDFNAEKRKWEASK